MGQENIFKPFKISNILNVIRWFLQAFKNIHFNISIYVVSAIVNVSIFWSYCYFGRLATGNYEKMSDSLYDTDWHEIPVRLQKYYVVMLANIQRPVQYHGFGVAILNLETFCKVRNGLERISFRTNIYSFLLFS